MSKLLYGFSDRECLFKQVQSVCDVLGHGANKTAIPLLLETMAVETDLGQTPDRSISAGMGIAQFDEEPFYDVMRRIRLSDYYEIEQRFGIDLKLVQWEDLRYNPFLSIIAMRLKYKLIPQQIPTTLEGRAAYWKQHYNSSAGKGTVKHYLESAEAIYGRP